MLTLPRHGARPHVLSTLFVLGVSVLPVAAATPPDVWPALRWRSIGPHRGGRTVAAVGVPGRPDVFYVGVNNGGVWRSDDYGRVWTPLFDAQPTGSIGALAVAPSNPAVLYVGSGEGLQRPDLSTGDGVYKSTDAGHTWQQLGLRDGQQIPAIVVDPRDPERLYVAVLGHPYGPNSERGVFRSSDGGRSFQRVLYRDEDTGAIDLLLDPADARTLYAALWSARQAPWEIGGSWNGPGSGLFKSTDGGDTWRPLTRGLPTAAEGLGRIGLASVAGVPGRLYALVDAPERGGLYRSDDAGESWRRIHDDARLWGRGSDFAEVKVDPQDPQVVYVANVVAWKSTDGGQSFAAWRGAPGGDDYHRLWLHPDNPKIALMAGDQGAIVTVNGGATWSSWYNQPTAQLYHVNTDNAFPYRVCGGQQESGSVCISSRGADGRITLRDWRPVGVDEYGYVVPDPRDPDIVYGGRFTRFDRRTGQTQNVAPTALRGGGQRIVRTQPSAFSPADTRALFYATNVVWKTTDGGREWTQISPDLTRETYEVPANLGRFASLDPERGQHRGVVYALAPSPLDVERLWAGTDDGQIHVTRDGGRAWANVTPPDLPAWAKVSVLEASPFDADTAYAAINTFRLDDLRPHIWRTRDGGRTWTHITNGLPDGGIVNVVRADPRRRGLLYAGTEQAVYVSFDDGEHWQSLRLGMPATSIRDLAIKDGDLVAATHGRGFWILDDLTPLRQLQPDTRAARAFLFEPRGAWRVRGNLNTDTPFPPDEPAGENPPDGATLDYWLREDAREPVRLELLDDTGRVLRRFSSSDPVEAPRDEDNVPRWWPRPTRVPGARAGAHRFVWDLREAPPAAPEFEYPIAAVAGDTPREPRGVWVLPGRYQVRLWVDGQALTRELVVHMDPRVTLSAEALAQQHALGLRLADGMGRTASLRQDVNATRERLRAAAGQARSKATRQAIEQVAASMVALEGGDPGSSYGPATVGRVESLAALHRQLASLYDTVQGVDAVPTPQAVRAIDERLRALDGLATAWDTLRRGPLARLEPRLGPARPRS
jgi:photosystem II stability/assembly factor-like uncharacterized protein